MRKIYEQKQKSKIATKTIFKNRVQTGRQAEHIGQNYQISSVGLPVLNSGTSRQLDYFFEIYFLKNKNNCSCPGSNRRPLACEASVITTTLQER